LSGNNLSGRVPRMSVKGLMGEAAHALHGSLVLTVIVLAACSAEAEKCERTLTCPMPPEQSGNELQRDETITSDTNTAAEPGSEAEAAGAGSAADVPTSADLPEGAVGAECVEAQGACAGVDELLRCVGGSYQSIARCEGVCRTLGSEASCQGECKPGLRHCNPEGLPEVCDAEGAFQLADLCPEEASACLNGACVVCAPGARRCSAAGAPEQCRADGSGYDAATPCGGDAPTCIPETGECGQHQLNLGRVQRAPSGNRYLCARQRRDLQRHAERRLRVRGRQYLWTSGSWLVHAGDQCLRQRTSGRLRRGEITGCS
jgi:hypothetical protein